MTLLTDIRTKPDQGRVPVRAQLARLVAVLFLVDAGILLVTTGVAWWVRGLLGHAALPLDDATPWTRSSGWSGSAASPCEGPIGAATSAPAWTSTAPWRWRPC
jgi:hypothetical protein